MAVHDSAAAGTEPRSGALGSLKRLLATLVDIARTRLQLLANEIQEEKLRVARIGLFAVLALFFFGLSVIFLSLLLVVLFWDTHRVIVVGALTAIYVLLTALFGGIVYKRVGERTYLFKASLQELSKDRERLLS